MINLEEIKTDELLKLVVRAGDEFYLNKNHDLHWTDQEYDNALDELKRRIPDFDIFAHLKGLNGHDVYHKLWMPAASKRKVNDLSWLVCEITLAKLYELLKQNHSETEMEEIPFILNYWQGNLKFVTFPWVLDEFQISQVTLSDLPKNKFPSRLQVQGNFRLVGTCKVTVDDIDNIKIITRLTETETTMTDILDIRAVYVKTDHFINTYLYPVDYKIPEWVVKLDDQRKFDQWWQYAIISIKDKFTPKMDGCSIVAYYKNGKFDFIASRSNDVVGKMKSDYLQPFFPQSLNHKGNIALMCESVIDLGYDLDWNSRQQANGLINSKYKICDISKLLNFVCYDAIDMDTDQRLNLDELRKDIYENNKIDLVNKFIENSTKVVSSFDIFTIIDQNPVLKGHLCGAQYLPRDDKKWRTHLFVTQKLPLTDIQPLIIESFNQKKLTDLNNGQSYTIRYFEHGLYGYIRYAMFDIDGEVYYFFDKRDFNRPRVTTVDYFNILHLHEFIDSTCQAHYHHSDGGTYLNDGLVIHTYRKNVVQARAKSKDLETLYPFHDIYKWTFNEIAETTITDIIWQESEFGTLIPVILFESVKVEGSWLSRASGGGLSHLKSLECGPGSKIKVVRVNSTIPMIIQVLTKSKFELPKCPHCGRQLTWKDDVYETLGCAKLLKCSNPTCEGKFKAKKWFLSDEFTFNIDTDLIKVLGKLINIESYKPRTQATDEVYGLIKNAVLNNNFNEFVYHLQHDVFVNMNRDKLNSFNYNATSAFKAIRIKIGKEILI